MKTLSIPNRGATVALGVFFLAANMVGAVYTLRGYAIIFVSDMNRSVSFYRDVIGMPLKFESPGWTEFATDGATVALPQPKGRDPVKTRNRSAPADAVRV